MQFVDVFPLTPDSKIDLYPAALVEHTRDRLYVYQPDPETDQYPLALISPASEKTVSSTLGELRERAAMLQMHPDRRRRPTPLDRTIRSASSTISARSSAPWRSTPTSSRARCRCRRACGAEARYNGSTSNALVPDSLTDLGDGACFNDARVQVALLGRH